MQPRTSFSPSFSFRCKWSFCSREVRGAKVLVLEVAAMVDGRGIPALGGPSCQSLEEGQEAWEPTKLELAKSQFHWILSILWKEKYYQPSRLILKFSA